MSRAELTETQRLNGDISQYLFDEFCAQDRLRFDGQEYELDGDDDGDPWDLIIRRKSDGKRFEIELEATAREVKP